MQPYRKKSNEFKSSDKAGQATGPLLPAHLPSQLSFTNSVTSFRNTEVLRHVAAKSVSVLREAHSVNAAVTLTSENSCNMELLNIPI
jgi:hypothetical protein